MQITTNQKNKRTKTDVLGKLSAEQDELNVFLDGDGTAQLEEKLQLENEEELQVQLLWVLGKNLSKNLQLKATHLTRCRCRVKVRYQVGRCRRRRVLWKPQIFWEFWSMQIYTKLQWLYCAAQDLYLNIISTFHCRMHCLKLWTGESVSSIYSSTQSHTELCTHCWHIIDMLTPSGLTKMMLSMQPKLSTVSNMENTLEHHICYDIFHHFPVDTLYFLGWRFFDYLKMPKMHKLRSSTIANFWFYLLFSIFSFQFHMNSALQVWNSHGSIGVCRPGLFVSETYHAGLDGCRRDQAGNAGSVGTCSIGIADSMRLKSCRIAKHTGLS